MDGEWLAERFEADRTRLQAVAYRMLGSVIEADAAVQETWLRLNHAGANDVENLSGWLTTVVARVCLDMLLKKRDHESPAFLQIEFALQFMKAEYRDQQSEKR